MNYNKEYNILFSTKEGEEDIRAKAKAFDEIAELFYDRNFGTATKADVELLMFSLYMEALIAKNSDNERVLNYDKCSDYEIAKTLGITQARVRTLKEKKQQRYPVEFDWKKSLAGLREYATYDRSTGNINLYIPDRNLFLEIQNEIERGHGYVDLKLNSKLLSVRPEYFIELAVTCEGDENQAKVIKEIKKELQKHAKQNLRLDDKTLSESLVEALESGASIVTIFSGVNTIFSPGNIFKPMITKLANSIAGAIIK